MTNESREGGTEIPPSLQPLVDILGLDLAIELVETAGGMRLYIPRAPDPEGTLAGKVGPVAAAMLAEAMPGDRLDVPVARAFMARYLRDRRGMSIGAIAGLLKVHERSVYRLLQKTGGSRHLSPPEPER
jgi:hypothetical protein